MYIGWDAQVIVPISAGGFGQIAMRDGMGYPLAAVATAEVDLAKGTRVRVTGTKGLNLLVAPVPSG
jgi:membrane protein implicated in regulation of membrane protease activity